MKFHTDSLIIYNMHRKDINSKASNYVASCGNCKESPSVNAPPLTRCGLCQKISYCCKECQTIDWPRHRVMCKATRDKQTKRVPSLETAHNISSSTYLSEVDILKSIEDLISARTDLNVQLDNDENTILLGATSYGYVKCVDLLLQHGADPNIADKDRTTPLHLTCVKDYDVCVSLLLQHGADPNISDKHNMTALYIACQSGHYKCALLLLQAGASVDSQDIYGQTPLYTASVVGQLKCVVVLVEHGADVNKCAEGITPLMTCAVYGRFQVMSYLLANGATVNDLNGEGTNALQIAHLYGHNKCVELLLEHGADESSLQGLELGSRREVLINYSACLYLLS